MPLSQATDRQRSRERCLHNERYNSVQRASRARHSLSSGEQLDVPPPVCVVCSVTRSSERRLDANRSLRTAGTG
jgi:hypothetical protein